MTTEIETLYELHEDGETIDLPDGRVLRLRIEPDPYATVNDDLCYGRIAGAQYGSRDKGRPEGFTGNAEKLSYGNDGPWWWEPPADAKRGTPEFATLRESVRELCAFGFSVLFVELCDGHDAFGDPIVKDYEVLGGVEAMAERGYLGELTREMIHELLNR